MNHMRDLIIARLTQYIKDSDGVGIPGCFDAEAEDYITDAAELIRLNDEDLLEVYVSTVGFQG